jgi:hypothetical protein
VLKFVCRDVWVSAFRKPIDKLQTNHMGVYVLHDDSFAPLRCLSAPAGTDTREAALRLLLLPCGLVRGALAAFGADALVNVDVSALPRAVFHVRLAAFPVAASPASAAATAVTAAAAADAAATAAPQPAPPASDGAKA